MAQQIIPNDVYVTGNLSSLTFSPPAASIGDTAVAGSAGIQASKLEHQYMDRLTQVHGSAATAERRVIKTAKGATGDIVSFRCGVLVACIGNSTITIDLYKNGSSILSATTVLDSGNAARAFESAAGFSSTTFVADDVFECVVTVSAGTGTLGQGLFCELVTREDAA
ncbi:MAG: hypothetical protein A3F84_27810 [Candidatus Handelsmanbacteria bacterium RIFCSPLOWO2_12_FULL_64_10]|uniref:Uncharacterized protein n=1 Tax=Handelsmanbacteria sp. (strain RIFCSPLOWO2_12_FULL_64_10) TaxID=1817868 RepID=A0A1F6C4N6_HANXR|nr:MAG: hypothetical protein A3F84_27810 [Candidatus Handelsmanbacteria bacterium RIFCSPLOWO2_12_FULL_64_10]